VTVSLFEGVDWQVVGLFLVLVLLEGLRRVPAGGLVIRRLGWSGWKSADEPEPRTRWKLVSWWSPLAPALVLPPFSDVAKLSSVELANRLEIARRAAPWLAAAGGLTLIGLVLGVPLASARFGALGFFAGAGIVLALAITTALAGGWTLRRLRPGSPADRRQVLGWCSPFASGRVLEGVYHAALAGASPAQALRALAGEGVFAEWARPRAYDLVHGRSRDPDLAAATDLARLKAIIATPPPMDSSAQSYCPRCAATWSVTRDSCPDCEVAARLAGSD
jgi:hypothetical protein